MKLQQQDYGAVISTLRVREAGGTTKHDSYRRILDAAAQAYPQDAAVQRRHLDRLLDEGWLTDAQRVLGAFDDDLAALLRPRLERRLRKMGEHLLSAGMHKELLELTQRFPGQPELLPFERIMSAAVSGRGDGLHSGDRPAVTSLLRKIESMQVSDLYYTRLLSAAAQAYPQDAAVQRRHLDRLLDEGWLTDAQRVLGAFDDDLAALLRPRLERRLRKMGMKPPSKLARELDAKLWGGFSRYALQDLESLQQSRGAAPHEVSYASWALARWHAAQQDYERVLHNTATMRHANGGAERNMWLVLMEAYCLTRLGNRNSARDLLERMLERRPDDASICLAMANTYAPFDGPSDPEADEIRLAWINRVYEKAGLLPLVKADPGRPLAIDNLATAAHDLAALEDLAKVSVIMPVYKAEDTLPFALRGVMAQTWRNLEIIIVDDCSPDDTLVVADDFARRDPRIRIVRQNQNQGTYQARNKGLEVATGDLITVHDADDWSHPQKTECQVRLLAAKPECKASMSQLIRVDKQLNVAGPWIVKNNLFWLNFSSLMVRRQVVDDIGGWDDVRVGGDAEYRSRILKAYGEDAICTVTEPAVLSFALSRPDSLTGAGPTNIHTFKYGQYMDSYAHWHAKCAGEPSKLRMDKLKRPFVAPLGISTGPRRECRYDLVVVCDYGLHDGAFDSTLHYIMAARRAGMSVAVYHWPNYDRPWRISAARTGVPAYNLNPRLYEACAEYGVDILTVGESAEADTVLIGCPAILHYMPDALPEVTTSRILVIVNQCASRPRDGSVQQYDPVVARANLEQLFGHEGLWIPMSHRLRRLMQADWRYPAPHPEIWTSLIDTTTWCSAPLRWRGNERQRPVVGCHGCDGYSKWPSNPEVLRAAYCADRACDVAILGGAAGALEVIGAAPANWIIHDFGSMGVREFLSGLDVFIHFPNTGYIEEGARSVIEAMTAGLPVILPPVFHEVIGNAALYVEPAEVWPTIERLWSDEAAYLARADAGRQYVLANCGWEQLPAQLSRLAKEPGNCRSL